MFSAAGPSQDFANRNPTLENANANSIFTDGNMMNYPIYGNSYPQLQPVDIPGITLHLDIGISPISGGYPADVGSDSGGDGSRYGNSVAATGTNSMVPPLDSESTLTNNSDSFGDNNFSAVIRRPDSQAGSSRDSLQILTPSPPSGPDSLGSSGSGSGTATGTVQYHPLPPVIVDASQNFGAWPEIWSLCNKHSNKTYDYFCYDCCVEICSECVTSEHNQHLIKPMMPVQQLYEETARVKNSIRDNIFTVMELLQVLETRRARTSDQVQQHFAYIRQLVEAQELEFLRRIHYAFEQQERALDEKQREWHRVVDNSDVLMALLVRNANRGNGREVGDIVKTGMMQLETLRGLQRMSLPENEEHVVFVANGNAADVIRTLGTVERARSIVNLSALNGNTMQNANQMRVYNLPPHQDPGVLHAQLQQQPPSMNMFADNNQQLYHPFQSFAPPVLAGAPVQVPAAARGSPPVNVAPSVVNQLRAIAASEANPQLAMSNYANTDVGLGQHGRGLAAVPANAPNQGFRVDFHIRRSYHRIRKPVTIIGKEGSGDDELSRPWGVCCDDNGHVIIADRSNNRIKIYRSDGSLVRIFGSEGDEEGQLCKPAGLAIDIYGRIVVADKDNHRIQIFTMEGKFVYMFGGRGQANGKFQYPWDVAVSSTGVMVVSDTRNHRIQLFTEDGVYVNKYGFECVATMWKFFDSPRGVCFTPKNTILVTDFNNHRLIEIDFSSKPARVVRAHIYQKFELFRPQGIAMDADANILVADSRNHRVVVYDYDGHVLGTFGVQGKEAGQFERPCGIALTPDGKIAVVDFGGHRVQIF